MLELAQAAVCSQINTKHGFNIQVIPHRKHTLSSLKTNQIWFFDEVTAVYYDSYMKATN